MLCFPKLKWLFPKLSALFIFYTPFINPPPKQNHKYGPVQNVRCNMTGSLSPMSRQKGHLILKLKILVVQATQKRCPHTNVHLILFKKHIVHTRGSLTSQSKSTNIKLIDIVRPTRTDPLNSKCYGTTKIKNICHLWACFKSYLDGEK